MDCSALKAGPSSNTLSRPVDMRICLYSWGDWARYAGLSKYWTLNSSAPPSAPAAPILGV